MQSPDDLGKLLVLSPHLDDAVFACGELLAARPGAVLVTLFAGAPAKPVALTAWDAASGFATTAQAVAARREEDRLALELLRATPVWLDFLDSQYGDSPSVIGLAEAIIAALDEHQPATVLAPAGLFHSDHILAHQAALTARTHHPDREWLMYEDPLYRRIPSLLQKRLANLAHDGIEATPVAFDTRGHAQRKRAAVQCYVSQLRALATPGRPGVDDMAAPEGYWRLTTAALAC